MSHLLKFSIIVAVFAFGVRFWWQWVNGGTVTPDQLFESYDYVIVGAGSAGCVLANRLSADPSTRVLLLEAGGHEYTSPFSHILGLVPFLQFGPMDWQYKTEPQSENIMGVFHERRSAWPRGKGLGGTSIINYALHVRGNAKDYDRWAELHDAVDWSWEIMQKYFDKLETVHWEDANRDYHTAQYSSTPDGRRSSTAKAYLRPVMNRENLHVMTHAHAMKVLIKNKVATGVLYHHGDAEHVVHAKEVILSAGSIDTPKLLMLSGIGDASTLKSHNIDVVVDNAAVGANLRDHVTGPLFYAVNDSSVLNHSHEVLITWGLTKALFQVLFMSTGPFMTAGVSTVGFHTTGLLPKEHYMSEIQAHVLDGDANPDGEFDHHFNNLPEASMTAYSARTPGTFPFLVGATLNQPQSVGYVTISSADPFDPPIIQPNYLTNPLDIDLLLEGERQIDAVIRGSPRLQAVGIERADAPLSMCVEEMGVHETEVDVTSDEYMKCAIRQRVLTIYHPQCTARMGKGIGENSVVDFRLRVHGVTGLRVIDASVFPDPVSGNTNIPVIAVAERAADIILKK